MDILKWHEWCRLCARSDGGKNIDLFSNTDMTILAAIGKYFWVNIKSTDLNRYVCKDCYKLIDWLVFFTERVNKVQAMYFMLNTQKNSVDPYEVRSQFDLHDADWDHIIKSEKKVFGVDYDPEIETFDSDDQMQTNKCVEQRNDNQLLNFSKQSEDFGCDSDTGDFNENENFKLKVVENASKDSSVNDDVCQTKECVLETNQQVPDDEMEVQENELSAAQDTNYQSQSDSELFSNSEQNKGSDGAFNSKKYQCTTCCKNYKNLASYRKHLEGHNIVEDLPEFICNECGKVLTTERQLSQHKRVHLPLEEKLTVKCPHCEKKYINETVMKQHIIHTHTEQSYVCEECGMTLKRLSSLKNHKLTHTDILAFKCESCDKGFKNKARLKAHMDAVHSTTTYDCTECDLKLNSKRTLKMHMLVHNNEKSYKCNFCDAEFKRGKSLKNHLIIHIGLRPYVCNFCNKSFTNGSNCRAHKKKIHPMELQAEEAAGLKNKVPVLPNLYELRACESVQEPRTSARNSGGITPKMRALLVAAEQLQSSESLNKSQHVNKSSTRLIFVNESGEEIREVVELETENDESYKNEVDDETIIFEVIDESNSEKNCYK